MLGNLLRFWGRFFLHVCTLEQIGEKARRRGGRYDLCASKCVRRLRALSIKDMKRGESSVVRKGLKMHAIVNNWSLEFVRFYKKREFLLSSTYLCQKVMKDTQNPSWNAVHSHWQGSTHVSTPTFRGGYTNLQTLQESRVRAFSNASVNTKKSGIASWWTP